MKILIVTGEPSGEMHATELIHALKKERPDARYYSAGGDQLAKCTTQIEDLSQIAVTGLFEVISYLPEILTLFNRLVLKIEKIDPDIIVFTDFPDFNFQLAKKTARPHRKLVYFISPQLWAWRKGRIRLVKRLFDKMLVIFPFEKDFYAGQGVDAAFVGNPIVNSLRKHKKRLPATGNGKRILLLPGSRRKEVSKNLPVIVKAKEIIARECPAEFAVLKHPKLDPALFEDARQAGITVTEGSASDEFAGTDLAIACSGTATFELAVMGIPSLVMYKMAPLTYYLVKHLVKVDAIAMPNIILGKHVFPEFIQNEATPENIAETAVSILNNPARYKEILKELNRFETLVNPFDSTLAANEILSLNR